MTKASLGERPSHSRIHRRLKNAAVAAAGNIQCCLQTFSAICQIVEMACVEVRCDGVVRMAQAQPLAK